MNKATKKILLNYIAGPVLLALLLWLIYSQVTRKGDFNTQWADFVWHWRHGSKPLMLLVLLLAPANWMLEALKWKLLLNKIEPVPFRRAFASTLTGIAFSMVTPNKIGDFAGRILYVADKNKLRAVVATLVGNLSHTIITFIFGIIGLVYFNIQYPALWPKLALVGACAGTLLLLLFYLRINFLAEWVAHKKWYRQLVVAIRILKRYSRQDLLRLLLLSAARFSVYCLQFLILVNVLGAGIGWAEGLLLSALMFWMITVIPSFLVADLGVRGFIAGLLFTTTGIAANSMAILAGSYLIWLLNLVVPAVIGSLLILTIRIFR